MKWINHIFLGLIMLSLSSCIFSEDKSDTTDIPEDLPQDNIDEVVDTQAPIITLNGDEEIIIVLGKNYIDDGVTVTDNVDSYLEATSTGEIDTSTPGTYTLYYDVIDTAGNEADTVIRMIHVIYKHPSIQVSFGYESYDFAGFSVKTYDPDELFHELVAYLYHDEELVGSLIIDELPFSDEFHNLEMNVDYDLFVVGKYNSGSDLGELEYQSKTIQIGTYRKLLDDSRQFFDSDEVFGAVQSMVYLPYLMTNNSECKNAAAILNNIDAELLIAVAELTDERIILTTGPITSVPEYHHLRGVDTWDGRKYDDVSGVCCEPSVTRIGTTSNERDVVLHEFGHSVDILLLWYISDSYEFREIWAEEKPIIWPDKTYFDISIEYFAEAFQWYYYSDITNSELLEKAPKTHAFIGNLVETYHLLYK